MNTDPTITIPLDTLDKTIALLTALVRRDYVTFDAIFDLIEHLQEFRESTQ